MTVITGSLHKINEQLIQSMPGTINDQLSHLTHKTNEQISHVAGKINEQLRY